MTLFNVVHFCVRGLRRRIKKVMRLHWLMHRGSIFGRTRAIDYK